MAEINGGKEVLEPESEKAEPPCQHLGRQSGSYQHEKKRILDGLRRAEGQVRGVQRMVEEERYCVDVINQIAAARMALARLALVLLEEHTRGCVTRAIQDENAAEESISELVDTVRKLV